MPLHQIPHRARKVLYGIAVGLLLIAMLPLLNFSSLGAKLASDGTESIGRRVSVGGFRFALLPRPNVTVDDLSVSDPDGHGLFAHFDTARFSLAWGELLRGRAELVDARVEGLTLNIAAQADGRLSIDDLLSRRPKEGSTTWRPERIDLVNASLNWLDVTSGQTTRFRNLDLHALDPEGDSGAVTVQGQVASPDWGGGLRIDSDLRVDRDHVTAQLKRFRMAIAAETREWHDGKFELSGDLSAAALPWRGALANVTARATVQRADQRWQASLKTPELRGGEHGLATGQLEGDFGIKSTSRELAVQVKLAQLAADASGSLVADAARLRVQLLDDTQNAQLDMESPLRIESWRRLGLEGFKLTGAYRNQALPRGAIKVELNGRASIDLAKEQINWDSQGRLDDAPLTARFNIDDFVSPRYRFGLNLAKLDLTPYLPDTTTSDAANASQFDPEKPLPLQWMSGLVAQGDLELGELDIGRFRVFNLNTHLQAGKHQLQLQPLAADIYGGKLTGELLLHEGDKPRVQIKQQLRGMEVAALMSDAFGIDRLSGRGNLDLTLVAPINNVNAMRRGLDGQIDVALTRGAIAGLDIGDLLRGLRTNLAKLTGGIIPADIARKTPFSDLAARFEVKNGVAESRDLKIRASFLNLDGGGKVDIGRGQVDYLLNATVTGGSGVPELDALKGLSVPIQITGALAAPSYRVDTTALREKLGITVKPAFPNKP